MTDPRFQFPQPVDILAIEREARALRARAVADMARAAWTWLRARFGAAPADRTA